MILSESYARQRLALLEEKLRARIYERTEPIRALRIAGPCGRVPFEEGARLPARPTSTGVELGPMWSTFWLTCEATVPVAWAGRRVDLLFVSHSEATLWIDGEPRQGLNHEPYAVEGSTRPDAVLVDSAQGGEALRFHVEIACNNHMISPEVVKRPYVTKEPVVLDRCDLAVFDDDAWRLYFDFHVLRALEDSAQKEGDRAWAGDLLVALNDVANLYDAADRATWAQASGIMTPLLRTPAATRGHAVTAVGHAHIDTAWMWPVAETMRKCVRTFSSQLAYMDAYPEHRFACSQAVQYAWMKEQQPALYARIVAAVQRGQWLPVGGTWVEPDCNIPSGESLARQFLYGQRFFKAEFGAYSKELWQPDVFGYNGQLPQLMREAGIRWFLTQKLSWNRFNKPQHHTLTWQGIDGSEVLAHFPPADTYNSTAEIGELRRVARDFKDHGRSGLSMLLFGHGDGGGGPTKRMLEVLRRARDLQGVPQTTLRAPAEFFADVERSARHLHTMVGELYFEYHRGTYTTHADVKRGNRRCEEALHDVEFLCTVTESSPRAELERCWKLVLLNQFHDILPGSSIAEVYVDARRDHDDVLASCARLRDAALTALVDGTAASGTDPDGTSLASTPVNTIGAARREVATTPGGALAFVVAPPYGFGAVVDAAHQGAAGAASPDSVPPRAVTLREDAAGFVLDNGALRVVLARDGTMTSVLVRDAPVDFAQTAGTPGREALAGPANVLELYDDTPTAYDAWDVDPPHLETLRTVGAATASVVVARGPLRVAIRFERPISPRAHAVQTVSLDAGARRIDVWTDVDWRESERVLKVAFPLAVRAPRATYEMQFGVAERPTHFSNSFDLAQYEVPGHRFADLSEHGFGVALLSESKYGFSCHGQTLRMTLLRAPKMPDPDADIGAHRFGYALFPHAGGWQDAGVVDEARRFSQPMLWASGTAAPRCFFAATGGLVLDTVKRAEDDDDVVLRLYEPHGARGVARVAVALPFTTARRVNLLEEPHTAGEAKTLVVEDGVVVVPFRPFEIVTVRLKVPAVGLS